VKAVADLDAIDGIAGVNLKIAKSGGLVAARAIGLEAKRRGLKLMVGGMVETKLGMTAAAHLAASLGGVDFADLDTAFLLAEERFEGGYDSDGPRLSLPETPGLGIRLKVG
jgi:L-alanine-DL-glutamate epimerase-like enolase superfamily enzyme